MKEKKGKRQEKKESDKGKEHDLSSIQTGAISNYFFFEIMMNSFLLACSKSIFKYSNV
jgi:hypothetical protein